MPIIPEYSFAEGRHAPSTASPDMAALPALANAKYIAPAILDVGEAGLGIAASLLKSEDARATLEVRNAWDDQEDELNAKLATERDGTRRRSLVETYLAKGWDALKGAMAPAETRTLLESEARDRDRRVRSNAEAGSLRISREQGGEAVRKGLQRALEKQDPVAAERLIDEGVHGGIFAAGDKPQLMDAFLRDVDQAKVKQLIKDHPLDAAKWIASPEFTKNFPKLPAERQAGLVQEAILAGNRFRSEARAKIANRTLQGDVLNNQELKTMLDDGVISGQEVSAYQQRWHEGPPADLHVPTYNRLVSEITSYRPAMDGTGLAEAQLRDRILTASLPGAHIQELQERLEAKLNPAAAKPEMRPREFAADFEKITEERFKLGAFALRGIPFLPESYGPPPISAEEWSQAEERRLDFTAAWEGYLRSAPPELGKPEAEKVYNELYRQMVSDRDVAPLVVPGVDPAKMVDGRLRSALSRPEPGQAGPVAAPVPASYGGQPVAGPGRYYRGGRAITGEGDMPGATVPREVLEASFPGKDEAWFLQNVKVVVETPDGRRALLPLSGTGGKGSGARRPVLDMTPAAVRDLGGSVTNLTGGGSRVEGIGEISFALTTDNAGPEADLANQSWDDVAAHWFDDKKPIHPEQIASGLTALRARWLEARRQRREAVATEDDQGMPRMAVELPGF